MLASFSVLRPSRKHRFRLVNIAPFYMRFFCKLACDYLNSTDQRKFKLPIVPRKAPPTRCVWCFLCTRTRMILVIMVEFRGLFAAIAQWESSVGHRRLDAAKLAPPHKKLKLVPRRYSTSTSTQLETMPFSPPPSRRPLLQPRFLCLARVSAWHIAPIRTLAPVIPVVAWAALFQVAPSVRPGKPARPLQHLIYPR